MFILAIMSSPQTQGPTILDNSNEKLRPPLPAISIGSLRNDDSDGDENFISNVTSCFCNFFAIIPVFLTLKMLANYPRTKLQ